jgi:hypothetical protein
MVVYGVCVHLLGLPFSYFTSRYDPGNHFVAFGGDPVGTVAAKAPRGADKKTPKRKERKADIPILFFPGVLKKYFITDVI